MKPHDFELYLERLKHALSEVNHASLDATVDALMECHLAGGAVYIIGNGGSASEGQSRADSS